MKEVKLNPPETLENHPFFGLQLNDEQKVFRDAIWNPENLIVFANSCAGTGKSQIATATAELLVKYGLYDHIFYLVSGGVGEKKQGFLPGDIHAKNEVYFTPFFQALQKIGVDYKTALTSDINNLKYGTAYITALSDTYLRGVNFEKAVVIVDEMQNFTNDAIKLCLTRCHDNCKVIAIGHSGQKDIEGESGFERCINHFKNQDFAQICTLTQNYRGVLSRHADLL